MKQQQQNLKEAVNEREREIFGIFWFRQSLKCGVVKFYSIVIIVIIIVVVFAIVYTSFFLFCF